MTKCITKGTKRQIYNDKTYKKTERLTTKSIQRQNMMTKRRTKKHKKQSI